MYTFDSLSQHFNFFFFIALLFFQHIIFFELFPALQVEYYDFPLRNTNAIQKQYVTFHGKTDINAFPLNAVTLTPNERRANDF